MSSSKTFTNSEQYCSRKNVPELTQKSNCFVTFLNALESLTQNLEAFQGAFALKFPSTELPLSNSGG